MSLTLKTQPTINRRNKVYFVPVTTLHRCQVKGDAKAIKRDRKFYWPINQDEAVKVVGELRSKAVRFVRESSGLNHWILDKVESSDCSDTDPLTEWSVIPMMQKFVQSTRDDFAHWKEIEVRLGQGESIDLTSIDHLNREKLVIYLNATGSSARMRKSPDPVQVVSKDVTSSGFHMPAGGGVTIVDSKSGEVMAEVFPNHIFVLVCFAYHMSSQAYQRKALMWICDQAAKIQREHFSTPEAIRQWRRKSTIPIHNLDPATLGKLLTDVVEQQKYEARKELAKKREEEQQLIEELEALTREAKDLEIKLQGISAVQEATRDEVRDTIIGSLAKVRGYESIAFNNGWLSGTTEVIYSKLHNTDPVRLFRIGRVRVDLNVITGQLKFFNLTYPDHSLAAPHIRQNLKGCLDYKISRDIGLLHKRHKFDGIFMAAMRLLTASGHDFESVDFPEVDPDTYEVINPGTLTAKEITP